MTNTMTITVKSGFNRDGFDIDINEKLYRECYYGLNVNHSKSFSTVKAPYVGDVLDELCKKFNIDKKDIKAVPGRSVFDGKTVSDSYVNSFKKEFLT